MNKHIISTKSWINNIYYSSKSSNINNNNKIQTNGYLFISSKQKQSKNNFYDYCQKIFQNNRLNLNKIYKQQSLFYFSTQKTGQQSLSNQSSKLSNQNINFKKILALQANLLIRNSQLLQLRLIVINLNTNINPLQNNLQSHSNTKKTKQKLISIQISKLSTLKDITNGLTQKIQSQLSTKITNIQYICNDGFYLPHFTPTEALLNRNFFIISDQFRNIPVLGQFQETLSNLQKRIQGLENLQFPAVKRNDIIQYIKRVDTWIKLKFGSKNINQTNSHLGQGQYRDLTNIITISSSQAKKILIQALLDPIPQDRQVHQLQGQFQRLYWKIQQMKQLKLKAEQICRKKVRNRMSLGLVLISSNIGFIWSGTYIIWSWDIVQPLAYFIDAFAGIVLTYQFFKMGKMYSHLNFQQYLFNKYLQGSYEEVGFDKNLYQDQKMKMRKLEAVIKDHYIRKLT